MKNNLLEYEKQGLNLGEIISYVRKNHTQTKPLSGYEFKTGETTFLVGPIRYTYYTIVESESIEVHDDFYLRLRIDIYGKSNQIIHTINPKEIAHKSVAIFFYKKDDIPDFKTEIETHFNKHINQLELTKTNNIYSYLLDQYL